MMTRTPGIARRLAVAAILTFALAGPFAWSAGIPEPGITLYGKVLADDGTLITEGRLAWTYSYPGVDYGPIEVTVSTDLLLIEDGAGESYSYALHLPAESPVRGLTISPNNLPAREQPLIYLREATLDGSVTPILGDNSNAVAFGFPQRGQVERVDLLAGIKGAPGMPSGPSPWNGQLLVPQNSPLDWRDTARAEVYDVYLWQDGQRRPFAPTAEGIGVSAYQPLFLRPDVDYVWQVVARNAKGSTSGPLWHFRTAFQPDLQKLLEHLLGIRYIAVPEQNPFDFNGDGDLDIADFVNGLKRTDYESATVEDTRKQQSPLPAGRAVALGNETVESTVTTAVALPVSVLPGVDGLAGLNLHIEADPALIKFESASEFQTDAGGDLYYHSPSPGVLNVVYFANPVNSLFAMEERILTLNLLVTPLEGWDSTRLQLEAAAVSDLDGQSLRPVTRLGGYIRFVGRPSSAKTWPLYR